jgi:hypothetical protein
MDNIQKENPEVFWPTIILNVFIILICFYLLFVFLKSKTFHSWPCINIITFSLILFLDNILRIIPLTDVNTSISVWEYIQGSLLVFFDKLILSTLTMQSIIIYLGVFSNDFYSKHQKAIFITTFMIGLFISIILTMIFILAGDIKEYAVYCYCGESEIKKILDPTIISIYLAISFFCNLRSLCYICNIKKEADSGKIEDLNFKHTLIRVIAMFLLNTLTYLVSYLIVYDIIPIDYVDIIYLTTCLAIAIYNSFNEVVIKATLQIFCKNTYEEKYKKFKDLKILGEGYNDSNEDENEVERVRTDSFN